VSLAKCSGRLEGFCPLSYCIVSTKRVFWPLGLSNSVAGQAPCDHVLRVIGTCILLWAIGACVLTPSGCFPTDRARRQYGLPLDLPFG
jgi:hypothetical protein